LALPDFERIGLVELSPLEIEDNQLLYGQLIVEEERMDCSTIIIFPRRSAPYIGCENNFCSSNPVKVLL
jgi:hypothetical protein